MFYKNKKVLVTGGTGFVGTHMVSQLLEQGAKVRIPVHNRPLLIEHEEIEMLKADLTRPEDCERACSGVDYVIHCAGAVSGAGVTLGNNPLSAITTNLVLTALMLEAACNKGVKRFLIFSSSTGYPESNYPITEEEMWQGPMHDTYFGYGWMRRYFERISEYVTDKSEMGIAIVRPTATYGPYDDFDFKTSHVIPALIRKAVERIDPYEVWGTGNEIRDFLYIKDLVRGCLLMLEKKADCDPINLGYSEAISIKEVVSIILEEVNYSDAKVIYNSDRPSTIPVRMVSTEKAKKLLGFSPEYSINDGLKETIKWYKQSLMIKR